MKPISIDTEIVSKIALLWLVIPVAITIACWFRPVYALPTLILIIASTYRCLRREKESQQTNPDNLLPLNRQVVTVLIFIAIWMVLIGIGGFLGQERHDNSYRNAVMEELVDRDWPVVCSQYQPFAYLNYYFTYWAIPALFGKIFYSSEYTWAQLALYIYSYIGLACVALMMMKICKKRFLLIGILFLVFSGCDLFNHIIFRHILHAHNDINVGTGFFEAGSAPYLCTFVYNQGIPMFVYMMLFIQTKKAGKSLFMLSLLFAYTPFMTLPLIPVVLILILKNLKQSITVENCAGLAISFLFAILYSGNTNGTSLGTIFMYEAPYTVLIRGVFFLLFNYAVFIPFIWKECKNDWIFWTLFASTMLFALLTPGYDNYDFGWKVPATFTFYFMVKLLKKIATMNWSIRNPRSWVLGCLLSIGVCSNIGINHGIKLRTAHNIDFLLGRSDHRAPRSATLRHELFNPVVNGIFHNFVTDRPTIYSKYFMPRQHADERNPQ